MQKLALPCIRRIFRDPVKRQLNALLHAELIMVEHCQKREEGFHHPAIEFDGFANYWLQSV